jgi:ribosomal protein L44E
MEEKLKKEIAQWLKESQHYEQKIINDIEDGDNSSMQWQRKEFEAGFQAGLETTLLIIKRINKERKKLNLKPIKL